MQSGQGLFKGARILMLLSRPFSGLTLFFGKTC